MSRRQTWAWLRDSQVGSGSVIVVGLGSMQNLYSVFLSRGSDAHWGPRVWDEYGRVVPLVDGLGM